LSTRRIHETEHKFLKEKRINMELINRFFTEEEGADAVEYALVIALIALAIVAGATAMGGAISNKLSTIGTSVANCKAPSTSC
jgi:pilus assembly protein Flp/PilA